MYVGGLVFADAANRKSKAPATPKEVIPFRSGIFESHTRVTLGVVGNLTISL